MCSSLTITTPEWRHWSRSGVFIDFEQNFTNGFGVSIVDFHHYRHHNIRFNVFFTLAWVNGFLWKTFKSWTWFLLTLRSFSQLLITSFLVFLCIPLGKVPLILKVLQLLVQAFSFILSTWPNHCSPLSCKHFFMLFNFSLALNSSGESYPEP